MHHSKLLGSEIPAVEGGYSRSVTWKGLPEEVAFRLTLKELREDIPGRGNQCKPKRLISRS